MTDAPTIPHVATAVITLRLHGRLMEWRVAGMRGMDDERILKRHMVRWVPAGEWVSMRWEDTER